MKKVQRGFSMIELVMVIGITGVLAAVAVPLFVDVRGDARAAALQGTADALASVASSNYAARGMDITKGFAVLVCADVGKGLQGAVKTTANGVTTITSGLNAAVYTITAAPVAANLVTTCTLNTVTTPVLSANFTATGVV